MTERPLRVLDLFAGLGGWSAAFRARGHEVVRIDMDERFQVELHADVSLLTARWCRGLFDGVGGAEPDVVLASPPCTTFSMMRVGANWNGQDARNPEAAAALQLVDATVELIEELDPAAWLIENPRAKLRALRGRLDRYERRTVTYCRLGEHWRKPTDLWGGFGPSLELPAPCIADPQRFGTVEQDGKVWTRGPDGKACHIYAPRGSVTSIQGDGAVRTYDERRNGAEARDRQSRFGVEQLADRLAGRPDGAELIAGAEAAAAANGAWHKPTLAALRAIVPYRLSELVCEAAERDVPAGRRCGGRATLW